MKLERFLIGLFAAILYVVVWYESYTAGYDKGYQHAVSEIEESEEYGT